MSQSPMQFNRLIPEMIVQDFARSLHFYVETIGFRIEYRRESPKFAFLSLQGSQLMLEEWNPDSWETGAGNDPYGRGVNFQIEVDSLEPILKALEEADFRLFEKPTESWYQQDAQLLGQREFLIQDPDGYLLRFAEDLGVRPAS